MVHEICVGKGGRGEGDKKYDVVGENNWMKSGSEMRSRGQELSRADGRHAKPQRRREGGAIGTGGRAIRKEKEAGKRGWRQERGDETKGLTDSKLCRK